MCTPIMLGLDGLYRIVYKIYNRGLYWIETGLSGLGGIVTDLWTCNRPLNPKNPFTIDKILTKSIFSINVNVVRLRDFSGSGYAHFPLRYHHYHHQEGWEATSTFDGEQSWPGCKTPHWGKVRCHQNHDIVVINITTIIIIIITAILIIVNLTILRENKRQRDANNTTLMLIVVISVFLAVELPLMIMSALHTINSRYDNSFVFIMKVTISDLIPAWASTLSTTTSQTQSRCSSTPAYSCPTPSTLVSTVACQGNISN